MKRVLFLSLVLCVSVAASVAFLIHAQTPPSAPSLTGGTTAASACRAQIVFNQNDAADDFVMSVNSGGDQALGMSCNNPPCNGLSYNHDYRTPKATYTYKVKARRTVGGDSPWSVQTKTVVMPDITAPSVPNGFRSNWAAQDTRLEISWNAASGITNGGYRLYYKASDDISFTPVQLTSGTTYSNITYPTSTTHYFLARAYETGVGCDTSGISTTADGIAKFSASSTILTIPATPTLNNPTATQNGSNWTINLSWTGNVAAKGYEFQLSQNSNFSNPIVDKSYGSNVTSYSGTYAGGTTLYYRVRAINNENGNIGASTYASGVVSTGFPSPANLSVGTYTFDPFSEKTGTKSLTFTWNDYASQMPRSAQVFQDGTLVKTIIGTAFDAPATTATLDVPIGQSHTFYVNIKTATQQSGNSNTVTVDLTPLEFDLQFSGEGTGETAGTTTLSYVGVAKGKLASGEVVPVTGYGESVNFGKLSFTESDFFNGYTDKSYPSGCAAPTYNKTTGALSGCARFIWSDATKNNNGWNGWVNLRGSSVGTGGETIPYGLCWGLSVSTTTYSGDTTITYPSGGTCAGDGATNKKLSGLINGGTYVGGWIVFGEAASSTANPQTMVIKKNPSSSFLAIRERMDVVVDPSQDVGWSVALAPGSSGEIGTISPASTTIGQKSLYTAPQNPISAGEVRKVVISAKNVKNETASTTINITNPYTLSCSEKKGAGAINAIWTKQFTENGPYPYPTHALTLEYSTSSNVGPWKSLGAVSTSPYLHENLATSTGYWYKLTAKYSSDGATVSEVTGPCYISKPVDDTPSRLRVFAQNSTTLYVNWKDNATSTPGYSFEIQRIKLTPTTSTNFEATSTPLSYAVPLAWKNMTTTTPYWAWVERSSSTDAGLRFKNTSTQKDPTLQVFKNVNSYGPWNGVSGAGKAFNSKVGAFTYNSPAEEATTFYYRIRACSAITPQYAQPMSGDGKNFSLNQTPDFKPDPACSYYTDKTEVKKEMIATTTPPKPAIKFTTTTNPIKDNITNLYSITLQWQDDSLHESGYSLERDGSVLATSSAMGGKGSYRTYTDKGLAPGETYTYVVRSYLDTNDVLSGKPIRILSPYVEAPSISITTPYRLNVAIGGDGFGGRVTGGGIDCPNNVCTKDYNQQDRVTLSAFIDDPSGDSDFTKWTGISGCNTNSSCLIPNYGTQNATANFRRLHYTLTLQVNPADWGTISGGGLSCSTSCSDSFARDTYVDVNATATSSNASTTYTLQGTWPKKIFMSDDRYVTASVTRTTTAGLAPSATNVAMVPSPSIGEKIAQYFIKDATQDAVENVRIKIAGEAPRISAGSLTASVYDAVGSLLSKIKSAIHGILSADAASPAEPSYSAYFLSPKGGSQTLITQPSFKDTGLDPDSVYYYRVLIRYSGSATSKEWSNEGAGKTLVGGGSGFVINGGICIGNSICDFSITKHKDVKSVPGVKDEQTEIQCLTNADCRDVGRLRQTIEEQ